MRLIDADDLKDWSEIVPLTGDGGIDINDFDEKLKSMQTVDAVPVIRCKDCGYWDYDDSGVDGIAQGECFVFSMMTDDMCFCCWAEGKDDIVIIHPEDIVFNSEEDEKAYYEWAERKEE